MASLGELFVTVGANVAGFKAAMSDVKAEAGGASDAINKQLIGAVTALTGAAVAASLAIDDAFDAIRIGTGAEGGVLSGLEDSFRNLYGTLPSDSAAVSTAIADLNTRLGVTGPLLETLAGQMLTLARITKSEVGPLIQQTTRFFGDWGVATNDQSRALDYLFRTSQSTGIQVEQLTRLLVQFGSPLRQMGFDWETAAGLIGKFEQEGVNTELVLGSLRIALTRMAKEGVADANAGLELIVERIKGAGSAGEANKLALEAFGAKAGPDMAAAIREGRFELDPLLETLRNSPETINAAAAATDGFTEQLAQLRNQATLILEPLGNALVEAMSRVMTALKPLTDLSAKYRAEIDKWPNGMKEAVNAGSPLIATMLGLKVETTGSSKAAKTLATETKKLTTEEKKAADVTKSAASETRGLKEQQEAARKSTDALRDAYSKLGLKNLDAEARNLSSAIDTLKRSGDWNKLTVDQQREATDKLNDALLRAKGFAYNWQAALLSLTTQQDATRRSTEAMFASMEQIGQGIEGVSTKIQDMPMGKINEELMSQAQAAAQTAGEIHKLESAYNQADLKSKNAIYEMLRDQIAAAEEAGETVPEEQRKMLEKMGKDLGRGGKLDDIKGQWGDFSREVSTIITNFAQSISDSLWDGDMSWGEKGKTVLKDLGKAVTSLFITPAVEAITGFVTDTINGLLKGALEDVGEWLGGLGSKMAGIFGGSADAASGAAGSAGSVGSVGGGSSSAGGAMGTIGAVSGVASAVSGVISNFQQYAINKSLDLIEGSTRRTDINIQNLLPKLVNEFGPALPAISERMNQFIQDHAWRVHDIWAELVSIHDTLKTGGTGVTIQIQGNVIGTDDAAQTFADIIAGKLALQGAG